ncbi:MAG: helix-turn-helix domain-containing protein [Microbacterium pygmaeum]
MEPTDPDPIRAAVDVLGDRWTLLVLRDIAFSDRRHFRALLTGSAEGIASNILADRLKRLLDAGLLARGGTVVRGQRARFHLTEAGIQTVPILLALGQWGDQWRPGLSAPDAQPEPDDPGAQRRMAELRIRHREDAGGASDTLGG